MSVVKSTLPTDYVQLIRELHRRAAVIRQPVNGTFELTERCNLSCRMCYVRHPANDITKRGKELTASQWLKLAQQAKDSGMVFLLLTGGEIFLRPDFFKIYMPLTRLGLIITLFTNGTLVTESIASHLAEAPPSLTEITLYGATTETYETVTGVPGSYARCCAGIEALVKYRIPLSLKTTITRQNVNELEAMRQMARNWGLSFSGFWLISKRRDGIYSDIKNCRLSATECVELEATDHISATEWTEAAKRESSFSYSRNIYRTTWSGSPTQIISQESSSNVDLNFYCQAGKAAFVINSTGEMNACLDLPYPAAMPLEIGFNVSWKRVQQFVDSSPSIDDACKKCDMQLFCPRCPAWSMLESGTLTKPVPYLCEIARARKERYVAPA